MKKWMLILSCLFLSVGLTMAQTTTISGTVVDDTGETVIGASVVVKGTTIGTMTDINGKFTINVPADKKTLVFSLLSMKTMERQATPNMNVVMTADSELLQEVVVTGMVTTDKRMFTGAADKLKADDVKLDGLADISRALEGRSAGVSVQNVSGTFGTAPKIRVRGATSIYGSSKPLWVVDGVIMEDVTDVDADALSSGDATTLISSAIAGLNAEDIESFDILKDGSATSIYGARAMAGVIVVTTKKGRSGVSKISYTGEYTFRAKPNYAEFNIMNSQDQMSVYQEMEQKGWLKLAEMSNARSSGIYGKMYDLINTGQLRNDQVSKNAYLRQGEYQNTNWFDELFNHNIMHNHTVSITSGTDKSQYYASISALVDPGWTKQSKVNRYTGNFNATHNISKTVTLNMITNADYRKQKAPGTLSQELDALSGEVKRNFDINPYSFSLNTSRVLNPNEYYRRDYAQFNILNELDNNYMDLNVVNLRLQADLKWKPIEGLELGALAAMRYSDTSQEHTITDYSNQAMAYRAMPNTIIRDNNPFLYTDPDNPYAVPISVLPEGGIYDRTDRNMLSYQMRTTANYNKTFDNIHYMYLYGGMELSSIERRSSYFRGWGMQYSMGEIPFYAYEVFKQGVEDNNLYYSLTNRRQRSVAYFANATYSYMGKYSLNTTLRYEGTNRLGKSRSARWLPTWNVGGVWNVHEESFFKSMESVFSFMKLNTSYSLTADAGPASVTNSRAVIRSYSPWRPSASVQESGLYIYNLENKDLTYEKKHEFNIGVSMGFLKNRISTEFAWYKRNNYDLIGEIVTSGSGGEVDKKGNVAEMKSHGVELSISTKNIVTKDFSWSTDIIYSHAKNEVTDLLARENVLTLVQGSGFAREGYAHRSIFSIPFVGLSEEGFPMFINQNNEVTVTDINFQERDKLDFLEYSGTADPTDFGSIGNIFTYKNFKLNVFVTYSWGNVVRLDPVFSSSYSDLSSMPKEFKNRWMVPGDEKYTNVPVIASARQFQNDRYLTYAYNAYNYSTERIAKGDFVRLKEVSLTYDFQPAVLKALSLSNMSLKFQATNLMLLYADKKLNGQDPEFFNSGGVATPVPRQFTMTLRLGL